MKSDQRLDCHLAAKIAHQDLAGQPVAAIDAHGVRTADPMSAGSAIGQCSVLRPLDLIEGIENAIRTLDLNVVIPENGLHIDFRVVSLDPQLNLHGAAPWRLSPNTSALWARTW